MLTDGQSTILENLDNYLLFIMSQAKVTQDDVDFLSHCVSLLQEGLRRGVADDLAEDGEETDGR